MKKKIAHWLNPPIYGDNEENKAQARILSLLILASWGTFLFVLMTALFYNDWKSVGVILISSALLIAPYALLRNGHLAVSSLIVVLMMISTITLIATVGQGIRDLAIIAFPIVFIFAGLTLKRAHFRISVGVTFVAIGWLAFGEDFGLFSTHPLDWPNWLYFIMIAVILIVAALAVELMAIGMRKSLELARQEISERKRAEEMALTSQKLASIGSLAAGMAHEINSPLQLVNGLSERMRRNLTAEQIDIEQCLTDIDTINRNGWRIARIIQSLLTYSRQSAPRINLQQLNDIVEDTLLLIEHQLNSWSNISVEKELDQKLPLVYCDSNSITQVIINLLENARDAMPKGGWIKISTACSPENGQVSLRVSDSGIGILADNQSRIFDPFFTTKDIGKGTGLGLSIVQGIVETHGGEINVESAPGKGTAFTICFPKEPPPMAVSNEAPTGRYD